MERYYLYELVKKGRRFVLKIAIIASESSSLINFRGNLIKEFIKNDLQVTLITPIFEHSEKMNLLNFFENKVHISDWSLKRGSTNIWTNCISLFSLLLILIKLRPSKVLMYTMQPVLYGNLLLKTFFRSTSRYSLITGLGYLFQNKENNFINKVAKRLLRHSLLNSNNIIFQNKDDLDIFMQQQIIKSNSNFSVISGSGVDMSKFLYLPPLNREPSFIFVGRYLKSKGLREFLFSAKRIKALHPQTRFSIVGWPDIHNPDHLDNEFVNNACTKFGVHNYGRVSDINKVLSEHNIFVLPSYREGIPRSTLEAMSIGRAIVTVNSPGCKETVIDGFNGYLAKVRSINSLTEKMMEFIENPDLILRMGKNSRKVIEDRFDDRKVNARMLAFLDL
jgi:glycosyltransferase involved in cell wall biosynthesis